MSILERLEKQRAGQQEADEKREKKEGPGRPFQNENYAALKHMVHSEMIDAVNRDKKDDFQSNEEKEAYFKAQIESIVNSRELNLNRAERSRLIEEV